MDSSLQCVSDHCHLIPPMSPLVEYCWINNINIVEQLFELIRVTHHLEVIRTKIQFLCVWFGSTHELSPSSFFMTLGTSTVGLSPGWRDTISPKEMMAGRFWTPPLKNWVTVCSSFLKTSLSTTCPSIPAVQDVSNPYPPWKIYILCVDFWLSSI